MLTKKGKQSRQNIIQAAITLIKEKGYEQTTIPDICRSANIAIGTFYHYFKSKDEIITIYIIEENEAVLAYYRGLEKNSCTNAILKVLNFKLQLYEAQGADFVRNMYAGMLRSELTYSEKDTYYAWIQILRENFLQGQQTGEFSDAITVDLLCDMTTSILFYFIMRWSNNPEVYPLQTGVYQKIKEILQIARRASSEIPDTD